MQATYLRFYVHEHHKHSGKLLFEWLLEEARALGIPGGSAFRAIAGYGRHGIVHEQRFFELSADLSVEVEFLVTEAQAESLLALMRKEKIKAVYARVPAEVGTTDGDEK